MKNNYRYIIIILISFFATTTFAQDDEWFAGEQKVSGAGSLEGWNFTRASSGRFSMKSNDGKYRVSTGGRFTLDGAYLQKDITPLSSGTKIKEARLNTSLKMDKVSLFFEVDFAGSKVTYKDITARYNFSDHNFIKIGYFTEPFSPNYLTTTEKVSFIGRPSTISAFAPPRSLGISYRHYNKYWWFETGVFGDDINQTYQGEDGYGVSGRFVGIPIELEKSHLHFGASVAYRIADSRGFDEDGSTYYNRKLNYTAGLQTSIHTQKFLTAYIGPSGSNNYGQETLASLKNGGAKDQFQLDFEIMDIYRNFRWQAEYIYTKVNRVMNQDKILSLEREANGGGLFPEKWEDISSKYVDPRPLVFHGYLIQAHYLIFGGDYKYQRNTATVRRVTKRALELSARYNYTSLNDIDSDATYYDGKFYDKNGVNGSYAGGTTSAISVSLNYIFNANFRFILEYTNQKFNNYQAEDENINMFQGRFQIFF